MLCFCLNVKVWGGVGIDRIDKRKQETIDPRDRAWTHIRMTFLPRWRELLAPPHHHHTGMRGGRCGEGEQRRRAVQATTIRPHNRHKTEGLCLWPCPQLQAWDRSDCLAQIGGDSLHGIEWMAALTDRGARFTNNGLVDSPHHSSLLLLPRVPSCIGLTADSNHHHTHQKQVL